MQTIE
jgi:hypothetical protein